MDIKEVLRSYIKEEFGIDDDPDFTDDAHLFDMGFLDSLGATQVILFIEEEFNIEITQKDLILHPMNTINEIALVIENKLS